MRRVGQHHQIHLIFFRPSPHRFTFVDTYREESILRIVFSMLVIPDSRDYNVSDYEIEVWSRATRLIYSKFWQKEAKKQEIDH